MEKIKHKYTFAVCYSIFLIYITASFILKTFVISDTIQVVSTTNADSTESIQNTQDAEITLNSYQDENVKISIDTITRNNTQIYVADIQVSDIKYLNSAFAQNSYGRNIKETTSEIAGENNAILAINGDYYGFRNNGYVIRNGVLYRDSAQSDDTQDLVIYEDGSFGIINEGEITAQELLENGAIQTYSFGPGLISGGEIIVDENSEVSERSMSSNPRTAIGMISPLHYLFVVSDGRTSESEGLSLLELAEVLREYGAEVGYNLDGGGSSTMVFNDEVVNNPTSGHGIKERSVSDIVYIGY